MLIKRWLPLVALLCLQTPVLAARYGSAPLDPSPADDEHFVVDEAPGELDTGCSYRSDGPLTFKVKVNRYVGPTDTNGTLQNLKTLIDNGVISEYAELVMPAYDIDSSADTNPETDKVYFNGHEIGQLTGVNNAWERNRFLIPIQYVKFPAKPGSVTVEHEERLQDNFASNQPEYIATSPADVENEISIDIDTTYGGWCAAIDWAQLQFKAMAPLLLIHGTGANPKAAWQELPGVVNFLKSEGIPFEHNIQLRPNGHIAANGAQLRLIVDAEAKAFGATKVHLVAHSKGGVDSRSYIKNNYNPTAGTKVLSLHTLSTPHNGTVIADVVVARRDPEGGSAFSTDSELAQFLASDALQVIAGNVQESLGQQRSISADRPAIDELRVNAMGNFNISNPYTSDVKLYTYGTDADANLNGAIEASETRAYFPSVVPDRAASYLGNLSHNILSHVTNVNITRNVGAIGPLKGLQTIKPIRVEEAQFNDLLVTDKSSQLPGQRKHIGPRTGLQGQWLLKNHRSIKDQDTMRRILDTIRADFPVK